ncbi:MAG: hypothetical protein EBZ49_18500, partial [Proteobacteria bacterium]|nr:hypothetical protein [Pseudomonadota bacterium]
MRSIDILDRPIAFHRCLAELGGSVNAGLMLSQALYWAKRTKAADGWFWKTAEEWQEETYLTRTEQATARKQLKRLSCWQEELRGVPAKLYYRVDLDELDRLLFENKNAENVQASLQESEKPVCRIPENKNTGIIKPFLLAETTTEITSETTAERVVESATAIVASPHTPQTEDAVSIALTIFPTLSIWQQEIIGNGDINHLALWRKACEDWRENRYSLRNITGLIDSYYRREKQHNRDKEYYNGQNQQHRPIRESHNERAARESL